MPTTPTFRPVRSILLVWTIGLASMLAWNYRSTPLPLIYALALYLVLVAWHLVVPSDRRAGRPGFVPGEVVLVETGAAGSGQAEAAPEPRSAEPVGLGSDSVPEPNLATVRPPSTRSRKKPRVRIGVEPVLAAWVEVAPGRFVRGEDPGSTPPEPVEQLETPIPAEESPGAPAIESPSI